MTDKIKNSSIPFLEENIPQHVYIALSNIQNEFRLEKTLENSHHKFKYYSLDLIYIEFKRLCMINNVIFVITDTELSDTENQLIITVNAKLISLKDNSIIKLTNDGCLDFRDDYKIDNTQKVYKKAGNSYEQRGGSATTYTVRYMLQNLLLITDAKDIDAVEQENMDHTPIPEANISNNQLDTISDMINNNILESDKILNYYNIKDMSELTATQGFQVIKKGNKNKSD